MDQPMQRAAEIHKEYRRKADNAAQVFSDLSTDYPGKPFPLQGARVKKLGCLAQFWGELATTLCGGKVDYIKEWRAGK